MEGEKYRKMPAEERKELSRGSETGKRRKRSRGVHVCAETEKERKRGI